MALHLQRVRLVVLLDETGHIHHQLVVGIQDIFTGVDTLATGRGNYYSIFHRLRGSRYAPQGSVDHRVSPSKDVVEEGNPPPSRSNHHLDPNDMDRAIVELREDLEYERDRRYALSDTVRQHR